MSEDEPVPMATDAGTAERVALSPRAGVALLTLQLRAAQHEAAAAEADETGWDLDASLAHLRTKLTPRVEERRTELDEEMKRERAMAAAAIGAARTQAAAIVAEAEAAAEQERQLASQRQAEAAQVAVLAAAAAEHERRLAAEREADAAELARLAAMVSDGEVDEQPAAAVDTDSTPVAGVVEGVALTAAVASVIDEVTVATPAAQADDTIELPVVDVSPDGLVDSTPAAELPPVAASDVSTAETLARLTALRTLVDELLRVTAAGESLPAGVTAPSAAPSESASIKVVIDADSFSQAFAAAISSVMDERLALHRAQQETWMNAPWRVVPVAAPPPKKSFWSNAWHADVLLSVLAMIIVLVVLLAWST